MALEKEDYEEPCCAFDVRQWRDEPVVDAIDVPRIIEKLDSYLAVNDLVAAEQHLQYWLATAQEGRDLKGELSLQSECMGFYRKQGKEEAAFAAVNRALELVELLGLEKSVAGGTMFLNAATVNENFGYHAQAMDLYEKAAVVYRATLSPDDLRLAGLYNNMALACVGLARFEQAQSLNRKALKILDGKPETLPDAAITYLNMADAAVAQLGLEEADEHINAFLGYAKEALEEAQNYLILDNARDAATGVAAAAAVAATGTAAPQGCIAPGYYAFVCDKCSQVYDHYGWFLYARSLAQRSQELYGQGQD